MAERTDATKRRGAARPEQGARQNREATVSGKALMGRLEEQSGELAVVQTELGETKRLLAREQDEARLLREAFEGERAARKRVEAQLAREREERLEAVRGADHAHATAHALEGQLRFLRAQVKALERKARRRHRFMLAWRRQS